MSVVGMGGGGLILCGIICVVGRILLWRAQNLGGRDSEKVRSGGSDTWGAGGGGGGWGVAGLN